MNNLPCSFCGGTDLKPDEWFVNGKLIRLIKCLQCYASAPKTVWNKRYVILEVRKEIFDLKKQARIRSARMQVLWEWIKKKQDLVMTSPIEDKCRSWFDDDGVPK